MILLRKRSSWSDDDSLDRALHLRRLVVGQGMSLSGVGLLVALATLAAWLALLWVRRMIKLR
jgi:hypothetical protein